MKNIQKLLISLLVIGSIFSLGNQTQANAQWKQDNTGGYYTEGDSYIKGAWKFIGNKWYYFYANGYMAHDTAIGGYYLGTDGAWIEEPLPNQTTQTQSSSSTYGGTIHHSERFNRATSFEPASTASDGKLSANLQRSNY